MGEPVDLTTCDLEPIHIIGRIQSFGYLLSFSSDWIINHASENCTKLFGRDVAELIGTPAAELIAGSALHDIRSRLQMLGAPDTVERMFDVDLLEDGRCFDVAIHGSGRSFVIECEESESGRRRDYVSYVRPMIDRMRGAPSVKRLCEHAARNLRGLTGFDRVMIYRFAPEGAGEVIAESRNGDVDSFIGLHFPASDIPAQARRLYARNVLRIISDIDDPTVPIVPPANPNGEPLDLSMSGLRAVSPIHIEYLRNMGVKASMSVSIMRRGKLWGLMACHHHSPLRLSYSVRTAAELFGEFFSYLLEQRETDFAIERRDRSMQLHDAIMARVASGNTLLEAFEEFADRIGEVIPFDGIVGWVNGQFDSRGSVPSEQQFLRMTRFLNTTGASTVWASDNLASVYPPAEDFADQAAGLLALPVSRSPRDYIVLFRKEELREVNWAGNPYKPAEYGPNGPRLSPRKSFDLWKEERRGYSKPWQADEITSAENLRITLLEVVLRLADTASEERETASKRQEMLIAELNHRVRNILNLIRSLVTQSKEGSDTVEQFAQIIGSRIHALARAHDQVTRIDWSPASLHELIRTECDAYASHSADRIVVDGLDAMVTPAAFTSLALVFHELVTNSCKYGALSNTDGKVLIALSRSDERALEIAWTESGGPAVTPPTRRGFGSTIIERTIPHELSGSANVEFAPEGLRAQFVLPVRHIASYAAAGPSAQDKSVEIAPARESSPELFAGTALIVEDNIIIAMETEDLLRQIGFESCQIVGSVSAARERIAEGGISFAMLDINLGQDTSDTVAQALQDQGVPFIFATGFGERGAHAQAFAGVPVVTKPYSERDLRQALASLASDQTDDAVKP